MKEEQKDIIINYFFIGVLIIAVGAAYKFITVGFSIGICFVDCQIFGIVGIIRKRIVFKYRATGVMAVFISIFIMIISSLVFIGYFFF